jgi:hypothetical protein
MHSSVLKHYFVQQIGVDKSVKEFKKHTLQVFTQIFLKIIFQCHLLIIELITIMSLIYQFVCNYESV